ncbi:MAG: FlgO family outer membrane protein [Pseudomonadota bacterium]
MTTLTCCSFSGCGLTWLKMVFSFTVFLTLTLFIGCGSVPSARQDELHVVRGKSRLTLLPPTIDHRDSETSQSDTLIKPFRGLLESSYSAADLLTQMLGEEILDENPLFLTASLVNINDLMESSTLGRIISEQISSRFAQHGFKVLEAKLRRGSVFIKEKTGEFLLSRELNNLGASLSTNYVIVGTYAVTKMSIFVSVRVVKTEDSLVVAGCDYELNIDQNIESMLK